MCPEAHPWSSAGQSSFSRGTLCGQLQALQQEEFIDFMTVIFKSGHGETTANNLHILTSSNHVLIPQAFPRHCLYHHPANVLPVVGAQRG